MVNWYCSVFEFPFASITYSIAPCTAIRAAEIRPSYRRMRIRYAHGTAVCVSDTVSATSTSIGPYSTIYIIIY
eukprot:1415792-Rhodomonas_salina.2